MDARRSFFALQPVTPPNKRGDGRTGQVLIFFLGLTAIGLLLAVALLTFQGTTLSRAKRQVLEQEAAYLAEAGLDKGFSRFAADSTNYTGESFALGGGNVTVTVAPGSTANERILTSSASVGPYSRRHRVKLAAKSGGVAVAFRFGIQTGTGGMTMGNGSSITGNVYSNQNITGGNGSAITGDASAVGTITGVNVSGTKRTGQPIEPLPAFDAAFWKTKAQGGTNISGNYSVPNGATIGPLYVSGDITFPQNAAVTVVGPVYAGGRIVFGNGVVLTVSETLGSDSVMLVADNVITFGNTLTVNKTSQGGFILIVSNLSSTTAINIGNGAYITNAPLYAPNGTIDIGNSAHAVAFTANRVQLGTNVVVTYDSGLANAQFTSGPGGSWLLQKGSYQETN